jgi:glyoxylase-like metal-dependent hydrolase (beta-lactamase superfamily II)
MIKLYLRAIIALSILLLFLFPGYSCTETQGREIELFALRYGKSEFQNNYVFHNGKKGGIPFAWMFWVVRDGSEIYLIDCGIKDEKLIAAWKIQEYSKPVTLLEKLNIGKKDIAGIIITHLHPDHFDGALFFPDSTFFLQKDEYVAIEKAFRKATHQSFCNGYKKSHYIFLKKLLEQDRLILISGNQMITHEISVRYAPFHTAGMQNMVVRTGGKDYLFVSDNAYLYQNIEKEHAPGIYFNLKGNLDYLKKVNSLDPENNVVIPGHDPEVFTRFPMVRGLKDIVKLN